MIKEKKRAAKIIISCKDFYFLQLRDNNKDILYPNKWCFFGGQLKRNEASLIGAKRELKEELLFIPEKLNFYSKLINKETETEIIFYSINLKNLKYFSVKEGKLGKWFFKKNIKELNLAPDIFLIQKNYRL